MNWVDFVIILILVLNVIECLNMGFIKSVFSLIGFILSIYLTKVYYPVIYGYIINNPRLLAGIKKVLESIIKILFYSKTKYDNTFLPNLLSKGILNVLIGIICVIITYILVRLLIEFIIGFISFIFKAPVLNGLNKIGGLLFGIIKGMFITYIIFALLTPILFLFPEGFIAKGVDGSMFSIYFMNHNLILDLFDIKFFI